MRSILALLALVLLSPGPADAQSTRDGSSDAVRRELNRAANRSKSEDRDRRQIEQLLRQQRRIDRQQDQRLQEEQQRSAPVTRPGSRDSVVRTQ